MNQMTNLDAAQSVFFAKELEHIKAKTYDVIKQPLRAFDLIPVSTEVPRGAQTISYRQFDVTGIAKIIANFADDLPRVNVVGEEYISKIRTIGDAYGYSLQDIWTAQFNGTPLQQRLANAAADVIRLTVNKIAFYGDATHGIQGWLTNANIPSNSVAADGTGSTTTWSTKTPAQILRDMNKLANDIVKNTGGVEMPDTIVLPIDNYSLISSTNAGMGTDTTILKFFLDNNPYITKVEWANELTAASLAANGITAFTGNIMIAYKRDPDKLTLEMPIIFEQLEPEKRNLEYVIDCLSRTGGVIVYYPFSMNIGEGI